MTICGYLSLHCVLSQVAISPRSAPEDWQTQWMQSSSVHSLPGTHLPGSSICSTKNQKSSIKKSMCRGFGRLPQVLLRLQYKEKPMQNNFEAPIWGTQKVFEFSIALCQMCPLCPAFCPNHDCSDCKIMELKAPLCLGPGCYGRSSLL